MIDDSNNVYTEVEVNATPEQVWSVMTDWKAYPEWCTSMQGISTDGLTLGQKSITYFKNPITGGMLNFEHEITDYEEGVKFGWSGDVAPGVKDHHVFSIEATEDGTTMFRQEDGFHGAPGGFMNFLAGNAIESSYKQMNVELKARVESLFPKA